MQQAKRYGESSPSSEGFHLYIRNNPYELVGRKLEARALKQTCYSPSWHKSPSEYDTMVSHREDTKTIVYRTLAGVGRVIDFDGKYFILEREHPDTREQYEQRIPHGVVVDKLEREEWFAL